MKLPIDISLTAAALLLPLLSLASIVPAPVSAFVIPAAPNTRTAPSSRCASLEAKKKKKNKKGSAGKGFGKEPPPPTAAVETGEPSADVYETTAAAADAGGVSDGEYLTSVQGGSTDRPQIDPSVPVEERTASILRDTYGLRTREEQQAQEKQEGALKAQRQKLQKWKQMADEGQDFDIFQALPASVLVGIDTFLKAGVAISVVLFVLAGLAITVEAWSVATNNPLPEGVDPFIANVVEPNFTPGLLVLLGFSVSLGAFSALQLGSSSSAYRED